jgi:hypothetical protein
MLPALASLSVVALIATLYVVRSGNLEQIGTGVGSGLSVGDGVQHSVYVDGWTLRTLKGKALRYQSGVSGTANHTTPLELTFSPLSVDELNDLVSSDPEIVEDAFARLVTGDRELRCDRDGCRNGSGSLSFEQLADLTTVAGLGSVYQAWNINAGLYRATFSAPEGAPITLSVENEGAQTFFSAPESEKVIGEGGVEITLTSQPDGENGWGRRSWYVAYAWGAVFVPETLWNDDVPVINDRGSGDLTPSDSTNPVLSDPALLARGLADVSSQPLSALSRSQLTYFSSPVSGCGVAALCVPDSVSVEVVEKGRQSQSVCSDNGFATAVALTTDWEVTLMGQTHALGAWNGKDPQNFPGAAGMSVLGYRGAPELVGGQLNLRVNLWMLVNSIGEVFAIAGSRGQVGVDGPEYTTAEAKLSELSSYFEGDWSVCSEK